MGLSLQLRQTQKLDLRLELRLEFRQKLELNLKLIAPEFSDFITFEDDDDKELLQRSFPFMILHEVSHPLQTRNYLVVPIVQVDGFADEYDQATEEGMGMFYHNGNEVGIDRGAYLAGRMLPDLSEENILQSNIAMIERVHYAIDEGRISQSPSLLARLDAAMRFYDQTEASNGLSSRVLGWGFDSDLYNKAVQAYLAVFQGTVLHHEDSEAISNIIQGRFC